MESVLFAYSTRWTLQVCRDVTPYRDEVYRTANIYPQVAHAVCWVTKTTNTDSNEFEIGCFKAPGMYLHSGLVNIKRSRTRATSSIPTPTPHRPRNSPLVGQMPTTVDQAQDYYTSAYLVGLYMDPCEAAVRPPG